MTFTLTFPYKSQTKELTINKELKTGDDPLEILYSDLGMTYETTADVYAIEFTLDSKVDARQLVLGNGTTVVDKASDYWYQAGSIALVKSVDRIIIDITGDQFCGAWKSVYVGQEVGTYKKLSRIITQDNFDIRKQSQLWDDYNIILKYLKKV